MAEDKLLRCPICGKEPVRPWCYEAVQRAAHPTTADHGETGWQAGMEYAATMVDKMAAGIDAHDAVRNGVDCPISPDVAWAEDIAESIRDRVKQGLAADRGGKVDVGESEAVERVQRALERGIFDRYTNANGVPLRDDISTLITAFRQHSAGGMGNGNR